MLLKRNQDIIANPWSMHGSRNCPSTFAGSWWALTRSSFSCPVHVVLKGGYMPIIKYPSYLLVCYITDELLCAHTLISLSKKLKLSGGIGLMHGSEICPLT